MSLTDKQKRAAEAMYRRSQLSPDDLLHLKVMEDVQKKLDHAKAEFDKQQKRCSHPLIMRDHVNHGSTGDWDQQDSYWTQHHCILCDMRWRTEQGWQNKGTKLGLPDDEQVKDY